ncbi:uncharacterized protein LOC131997629 [Stomoxys calcitrans]|uniref:uncharacterized protein LOC131997629 n=1 Tax=Stomoxys calcitrans TaxID=35570 RepID=UPI0027E3045A|nr:uncharacterized protein LOC131997629 [Stomoxys calcitrans]
MDYFLCARKFFLVVFAVIAAVAADVSHLPSNEYLPPQQEAAAPVQAAQPSNEYLPPVQQHQQQEAAPAHELADDGYRYKTHRRVVYRRNRRDVSNEYLPPVQEAQAVEAAPAPVEQYAVAEEAAPAHELADDGYRYKTHRRVVYRRNRRDVSHLSNEYLPPVQQQQQETVEIVEEPIVAQPQEAEPAHQLADDGYRYKTHRRVVYRRNRRDVSHLSNEYLPPVQEAQAAPAPVYQQAQAAAPSNEYLPPVQQQQEAAPAHELADDGYRYKTHRRVVYRRNRRDVSHLSNEYLPPVQEAQAVEAAPAPVEQYAVAEEAAPAHELADDGYRYKTHRRVVYRRNRRDVSHLSNEYLPPVQEAQAVEAAPAPVEQYAVAEEAAPAHELADDGYRYKTHRRVVYRRNRRDVSHLSNEYLPPVQEAQAVEAAPAAVEQYAVAEEAAPAHELADDGYRYKTHRRVVYRRNRRDVSNEYLPPVQEAQAVEAAPAAVEQYAVAEEAAPAHELADDGYRYKTHRRVVYRRNRRDVSNEYLPPVQEAQAAAPTSEYLPPVQQQQQQQPQYQEAAPAHELADDGYRYKTFRRVVYRRH